VTGQQARGAQPPRPALTHSAVRRSTAKRAWRPSYGWPKVADVGADPLVVAVAIVVVAAGLLRFLTLDLQSYYVDEAFTVSLVRESPIEMLRGIARTESTPPLYYSVAWLWSRLFGTGEVGLRSLSALAGTASVVLCYLAAARMASRRAGLVVAALAAVSPLLVWYSQEARSYALFTFFAAFSIYLYARLRARPTRGAFVAWAAVCAAAMWTHYFAVFLVAAEALLLWILDRPSRRSLVASVCALGVALLPVAPLLLRQVEAGNAHFIGELPFDYRVRGWAQWVLFGRYDFAHPELVAALLAVLVVGLLAGARSWHALFPALEAAALGAGIFLLPLLPAALGRDYWYPRNVMPGWVAMALVVAVAVTTFRVAWIGGLIATMLVGFSLVPTVLTFERHAVQRQDWRGLHECLGPPRAGRAIVLRVGMVIVFTLYRPAARPRSAQARYLSEVDAVEPPPPSFRLPRGFTYSGRACADAIPVSRFVARRARRLTAADVLAASSSDYAVVVDSPTKSTR
jgi:mannosyltransferase